jgi:hypothetical protein
MTFLKSKKFAALKILIAGVALLVINQHFSLAQTPPQIIFTWEVNNYFPADYAGKALPTYGAPVSLAAEVLKDNKLLDTSQANFLWYVDDKLITSGLGQKEISFKITKRAGDTHFVRVIIDKDGENIESNLRIPIFEPKIVIDKPLPENTAKVGEKILLQILPYFFNIKSFDELIFGWEVNNKDIPGGGDNQLLLTIGAPRTSEDRTVQIKAAAQNRNNPLETATARTTLKIQ